MSLTTVQPGMLGTPQPYSFKNRVINGAMAIDQRNSGTVNTPANGGYSVDRWQSNYSGGGVYSCQQVSTAPAGFFNSLKLTVTTADSSIAATDVYVMVQVIEGYNLADLNQGTTNAKSFTLSFWVQSSVTGTYSAGVRSGAGDVGYAFNYTISAANTWTYVSATIPGTSLGTWATGNTSGLILLIDLGSGSNRNLTPNTWTSGIGYNTSSQTPWISTNGATFYLTGVQLEAGTTATSFDYRPYGTELALCQRYFYNFIGSSSNSLLITTGQAYSTTNGIYAIQPFVPMRTTPTLSYSGVSTWTASGNGTTLTSLSIDAGSSERILRIVAVVNSALLVTGNATGLNLSNASSYINFSAEL